jgi:hypothetical protein
MRSLVQYNSAQYRNARLRVVPGNITGGTSLFVSQFAGVVDAKKYFDDIKEKKTLFSSLGETAYELYMVSAYNLNKLQETADIDEYIRFYQRNYIARRIADATAVVPVSKPTVQPNPIPVSVSGKTTETKTDSTQTIQPISTPVKEIESGKRDTIAIAPETVTLKEPETASVPVNTAEEMSSSDFIANATAQHNFIVLIPAQGYNSALLISYLKRFNATMYAGNSIEVTTEPFNEVISLIKISNIGEEAAARKYFENILKDSRITMSLRNVNYKQYIITNSNLKVLVEKRNAGEYHSFHQKAYNF